ncbi:hypothetical protein ENSA7_13530 [Enhygromyxa salina]|uniref:Uncharacterized protein n=1 Tax=Enhygromyxa salina TaxID=215803 RepID=A0A2S9YV47_9BACT|nr:hypothetical protein ENSA7_13530 [Enhygromyxa salina]
MMTELVCIRAQVIVMWPGGPEISGAEMNNDMAHAPVTTAVAG